MISVQADGEVRQDLTPAESVFKIYPIKQFFEQDFKSLENIFPEQAVLSEVLKHFLRSTSKT